MQGYSPKLPLTKDNSDGLYLMNKTPTESIKQDLKMLILTSEGERMMLPDYGVGIKKFLFEHNISVSKQQIMDKIKKQVSRYMSFINLDDISITTDSINENMINISIYYSIPGLSSAEELSVSLSP